MTRVMLVDGTNLLVRAAHAGQHARLSHQGVETGALVVFANLLSRHIREEEPDSVVVCWDGGKSTYRQQIWTDYKANRADRPEDEPERPFAQAKEFLTLAGIHHVERAGWEADDLIACYWRTIRPSNTEIVILSGDKDLLQLVDSNCYQVRPTSQREVTDRWDVERIQQHYGCEPCDLSKVMALIGDTSDGIPGARGVGPKRAPKMMAAWQWDIRAVANALDDPQILTWHRLIDLRDVPFHSLGLTLQQPPRFTPTSPGDALYPALTEYLVGYGLESVRSRVDSGEMWGNHLVR